MIADIDETILGSVITFFKLVLSKTCFSPEQIYRIFQLSVLDLIKILGNHSFIFFSPFWNKNTFRIVVISCCLYHKMHKHICTDKELLLPKYLFVTPKVQILPALSQHFQWPAPHLRPPSVNLSQSVRAPGFL